MEYIVKLSIIFGECKRIFNEWERDLSFNEALVLEAVSSSDGRAGSISRYLSKDRGYIHRVLKDLMVKDLVVCKGKRYILTPAGSAAASSSRELLYEVAEQLL